MRRQIKPKVILNKILELLAYTFFATILIGISIGLSMVAIFLGLRYLLDFNGEEAPMFFGIALVLGTYLGLGIGSFLTIMVYLLFSFVEKHNSPNKDIDMSVLSKIE